MLLGREGARDRGNSREEGVRRGILREGAGLREPDGGRELEGGKREGGREWA